MSLPYILIMDLAPSSCQIGSCGQLFTLIRRTLPAIETELRISTDPIPEELSRKPDLILFRPARTTPVRKVLYSLRESWLETPILGLLCSSHETLFKKWDDLLSDMDDFFSCPLKEHEVATRVRRLLHGKPGAAVSLQPTSMIKRSHHFGGLVGESQRFHRILEKVPLLAQSDATVLISGETGTGKDMFARAIHYQSARHGKPFIPVNCGALPDHLCENELFGHAKGAFTDASSAEKGLIAEAEGGTLFLDEIDTLSASAQTKLLRFLQDQEYRPLGSSKGVIADVRIIAATNSDLRQQVRAKQFREDLFYRLNVLSLSIPPLRDNIEDIPLLANHFLARYATQYRRGRRQLSSDAMQILITYPWPGNVRELEGVLQRAVILCSSSILSPSDIDLPVGGQADAGKTGPLRQAKTRTIGQFERAYLIDLLSAHKGNVTHAAKAAGKERRTLQRLLHKYGLERQAFRNLI
jgi:DNA-binding NtrC family response regulator